MAEKTINAIDVREPQTVTKITAKSVGSRWKRKTMHDQGVRQTAGEWPTVTSTKYREDGEGNKPTVYIEMSDAPGWVYCLAPDDQVTVLA